MTLGLNPRERRRPAVTADQQAADRAEADEYRARLAAERSRSLPFRRAMMLALVDAGLPLADPDGAADCLCGCHQSLGDLHDMGTTCVCQLGADERAARSQQFRVEFEELTARTPVEEAAEAAEAARVAAHAAGLGVALGTVGGAAPFVVSGVVDGRGFYLRERSGLYRVTVAGDDHPDIDPWGADASDGTIDLIWGDADDLVDTCTAIDVAVSAVRTWLRQRHCTHPGRGEGDRYCSRCGAALVPTHEA